MDYREPHAQAEGRGLIASAPETKNEEPPLADAAGRAEPPGFDDALRFLSALHEDGEAIEIRRKRTDGTVRSSVFRSAETAGRGAVRASEGGASAVWTNLNPRREDAGDDAATTDAGVSRRRFVLIDFDPARTDGSKGSATDEEKRAALAAARIVRGRLTGEFGWPEPIETDSGNGTHLIFNVDLPNGADAHALADRVLAGAGTLVPVDPGGVAIKVDRAVKNAGRVVKVPGTTARKGEDAPDRPHRRAKLLRLPEKFAPVPIAALRAVAALAETTAAGAEPTAKPARKPAATGEIGVARRDADAEIKRRVDVRAECERWGIEFFGTPDVRGFLTCRAIDRTDRNPSAGVNVGDGPGRGTYNDFGGVGRSLGFFELAAERDPRFADWRDARDHYARETGLPPGPPRTFPAKEEGGREESSRRPHSRKADAAGDADEFIEERYRHPGTGLSRLRHHHGEFHRWRNGRYVATPDADVIAELWDHLTARYTHMSRTVVGNTLAAVQAKTIVPSSAKAPCWLGAPPEARRWLAVENGLLNVDAATAGAGAAALRPHTPEWFSPVRLPYPFDPDADCPIWRRTLETNLNGDDELIAVMQETFGYLLTPSTGSQRFVMLHGEAGTGKSVALAAMRAQVGAENCGSVELERFADRFALWGLRGKLLNAVAEIGEVQKVAEGRLKAFTAGDLVEFERKGRDSIFEVPTARCVFATNNLPRFADRTDGIWRRMLLMPFDRKVPDGEKVEGMTSPDWWRESGELPGMLNWALEGRRKLAASGFTKAAASAALLAEHRDACNPAAVFLAERYERREGAREPKESVYRRYRNWALAREYRPLSEGPFGKEVLRTFPGVTDARPRIDGRRVRVYSGLAVNDEEGVDDDGDF